MNGRLLWILSAFLSCLMVSGITIWWHVAHEREKARAELDRIEANRSPPLDYGDPAGSFLSQTRLDGSEIERRVAHPETPTLAPGSTVWACFARVTWLRNDCTVFLHWWYEELPQENPDGPRLRLDFDQSERELNHQDYLGRLPAKCRALMLPEQLVAGRQYALASKATAQCPGTHRFGPIYVAPPETRFIAGDQPARKQDADDVSIRRQP